MRDANTYNVGNIGVREPVVDETDRIVRIICARVRSCLTLSLIGPDARFLINFGAGIPE